MCDPRPKLSVNSILHAMCMKVLRIGLKSLQNVFDNLIHIQSLQILEWSLHPNQLYNRILHSVNLNDKIPFSRFFLVDLHFGLRTHSLDNFRGTSSKCASGFACFDSNHFSRYYIGVGGVSLGNSFRRLFGDFLFGYGGSFGWRLLSVTVRF